MDAIISDVIQDADSDKKGRETTDNEARNRTIRGTLAWGGGGVEVAQDNGRDAGAGARGWMNAGGDTSRGGSSRGSRTRASHGHSNNKKETVKEQPRKHHMRKGAAEC